MSDEHYYAALVAKDRRFDGKVFFGVRTTGIYCRPICPARTPLAKNVVYYPTAIAAELAGFRPCRRCRPEASPGTPAWAGTSAIVTRALRLLSGAPSDEKNVSGLSDRLGVTERHLRRLFVKHLGAPPHRIWQTRRLDFAKQLIDQTPLPITEVAFASGFQSLRRFNAAFKARFGIPPSVLRHQANVSSDRPMILRLTYRPPFAWAVMLSFLSRRAIPGMEHSSASGYARTLEIDGEALVLQATPVPDESYVELSVTGVSSRHWMYVVDRARQLFDLESDPLSISQWLAQAPSIRELVNENPGLRVAGCTDGFELAVRTILGQQISVEGARTLAYRIVNRWGRPVSFTNHPSLNFLFPRAAALRDADLRSIGLTAAREKTIRELAARVDRGELDLNGGQDPQVVRTNLLSIPGVGPWTVEYIAMRALRDPNAFPATDLVLRRQQKLRNADPQRWEPWRAYGALYLWNAALSSPPPVTSTRTPLHSRGKKNKTSSPSLLKIQAKSCPHAIR